MRHAAYAALPDGCDRFAYLEAAFDLLGWEISDRRRVTGHSPLRAFISRDGPRHAAWLHEPGHPKSPGLIALDHRWDPRLSIALSRVTGQLVAESFYDRHTFDWGFAVAYAGVPMFERSDSIAGAMEGEAHVTEFRALVNAACENSMHFYGGDEPEGELVVFDPPPGAVAPLAEISRILLTDVPAGTFEPPAGWSWNTDEPYGAPYITLQRQGPLDDALVRALSGLGELMAVNVRNGGGIRWLHLGAGHDESGDGNGWRDLLATWPRLAPHLLLPPREIIWPRIEPV